MFESVTQLVYGQDIRELNDALSGYVVASRKEAIWVLVDNLDKSWPVQSARAEDILLIRSLLEASSFLRVGRHPPLNPQLNFVMIYLPPLL